MSSCKTHFQWNLGMHPMTNGMTTEIRLPFIYVANGEFVIRWELLQLAATAFVDVVVVFFFSSEHQFGWINYQRINRMNNTRKKHKESNTFPKFYCYIQLIWAYHRALIYVISVVHLSLLHMSSLECEYLCDMRPVPFSLSLCVDVFRHSLFVFVCC